MNHKHRLHSVVCALVVALAPALALGQQYEKIDDPIRPRLSPSPFVLGAYGFIWAAVLVYVVFVAKGLARVRGELDSLRTKVDREGKKPTA